MGATTRNRTLAVHRREPVPVAGRTSVIGLIVQHTTAYETSRLVQAIGEAAAVAEISIVVRRVHHGGPPAELHQTAEQFVQSGVAGLVLASVGAEAGADRIVPPHLPVVTVDGADGWRWPDVSIDQFTGGLLATRHLLGYDHRTVWHVAGPERAPATRTREAGWRAALAEAGLTPRMVRTDGTAASAYECGLRLARVARCTAIFAANDYVALGVMRGMREGGRRIPEDVSLVGYDDVPEAAYLQPPLTTVGHSFAHIGTEVLRLLVDRSRGGVRCSERVSIRPTIMSRCSVA
ncbi:LacI family transcriptional regulator [Paractinoplanes rishiriensis]|uniref:LacI family transcriptional regulator n=1 Tax=Paractinoplanes rishiriensis TaxID=1050105 RepID=A0A919K817_9ACTN|nr:LacI family transcriptional regulator [Actinoplanes rishiriensis]